eukprot:c6307_g1_i1 orf=276-488(+)
MFLRKVHLKGDNKHLKSNNRKNEVWRVKSYFYKYSEAILVTKMREFDPRACVLHFFTRYYVLQLFHIKFL